LVRRSDFERYAGERVRIEMAAAIDGRRRFRGLLLGAEGNAARLRREDAAAGEPGEILLPIGEMAEARIVLSDTAIAESLRRGKRQQQTTEDRRERTEEKGSVTDDPSSVVRRLSSDSTPQPAISRRAAQHEGE
jgi:ribosome maturation factor RimP